LSLGSARFAVRRFGIRVNQATNFSSPIEPLADAMRSSACE